MEGRNCEYNINVNESCSTPWIGGTVKRSYFLHEISGYMRICSDFFGFGRASGTSIGMPEN